MKPLVPEDEFIRGLAQHLGRDASSFRPALLLGQDLQLDDLEILEALMFVGSLALDFALPEQLDPSDVRLGDLYHYYETHVAHTREIEPTAFPSAQLDPAG